MTVGVAFIISVVIAVWVDDFLLANFVPPGDAEALARDVADKPGLLWMAAAGYLSILFLDCLIGLALFIVFKPASSGLAFATSSFRLVYAAVVALGVIAMALGGIDAYGYSAVKNVGYGFFIMHLLTLGAAVLKADYIPNPLGVALIVGAFSYTVFFVDVSLPEPLMVLAMLIMALAELALSVWLIVNRRRMPGGTR
ncbi:MAG: DUF4386 domain-containing protein [Pseudomonadota bacterium]